MLIKSKLVRNEAQANMIMYAAIFVAFVIAAWFMRPVIFGVNNSPDVPLGPPQDVPAGQS